MNKLHYIFKYIICIIMLLAIIGLAIYSLYNSFTADIALMYDYLYIGVYSVVVVLVIGLFMLSLLEYNSKRKVYFAKERNSKSIILFLSFLYTCVIPWSLVLALDYFDYMKCSIICFIACIASVVFYKFILLKDYPNINLISSII